MKKVYVDEVNRILCLKREKKRYRYDDRTNPVKAREMFEIYQSHHNPKKDIDRAIRLHRGLHSTKYVKEVKRKFENKADRHTFQKVFGNKRGDELWDCFLEVGKSIFILEDSYFLINDRNVFSLCLAECSDYDLYELVHNIETDSDQGK